MPARPTVALKPGAHRRALAGHPWVYANEIEMEAAKALPAGSIVALRVADGRPLGVAMFNAHALISARLVARDLETVVDRAFLARRIERALGLRQRLFADPFYRLVHAEADGLPGAIIDRFGDALAVQLNTAGMDRLTDELLAALDEVLAPRVVVLRNDAPARTLEGLDRHVRVAKGDLSGPVELRENGCRFLADLAEGQKTGWFYDQRLNRAAVARLGRGGRVLDLYCYSGGFAVWAAAAGASEVLGVDRSAPALELAARAAELNGLAARCRFQRAEAFGEAARLADAGERFDVVIADPPAFVKSHKELQQGAQGYRKLARLAAALVRPGGFLFLASCSHALPVDEFQRRVARGIHDAGRDGRILGAGGAGPDHPVHPALPETAYLKTLLLQLD